MLDSVDQEKRCVEVHNATAFNDDEDDLRFLSRLTMSKPDQPGEGGPADGSWKTGHLLQEKAALTKVSGASPRQGWTKVSCACCVSEQIEPLVLVKLGPNVGPETKRWLIRLIGAPQKDGGEIFGLVVHRDLQIHEYIPFPLYANVINIQCIKHFIGSE